jgi:hypothetical protein
MSKTLIVYTKDSHYKYFDLFHEHIHEVCDSDLLIYKRNTTTGEESLIAYFKTWDYFIIE